MSEPNKSEDPLHHVVEGWIVVCDGDSGWMQLPDGNLCEGELPMVYAAREDAAERVGTDVWASGGKPCPGCRPRRVRIEIREVEA